MAISTPDFNFIRQLAEENAGISIEDGKEYLVVNRLEPTAKECGYESLSHFINELKRSSCSAVLTNKTIDALTINETSFYRDVHPFEHLKQSLLPRIIADNQSHRTLSIWSAACSTGQEIYSLAILLKEHFPEIDSWDLRLFATDISNRVLNLAQAGVYSSFEINRGLEKRLQDKYFEPSGNSLQLKHSIRDSVDFQILNLNGHWPDTGKFDIILLRNVMIYFDLEAKKTILNKVKKRLNPNGHLFLGSAETTYNIDPEWVASREHNSTSYYIPAKN